MWRTESDTSSLKNAWRIQIEHMNDHCRCVIAMTVNKRALLCGYGKDSASALCGPVARMLFAESVPLRALKAGLFTVKLQAYNYDVYVVPVSSTRKLRYCAIFTRGGPQCPFSKRAGCTVVKAERTRSNRSPRWSVTPRKVVMDGPTHQPWHLDRMSGFLGDHVTFMFPYTALSLVSPWMQAHASVFGDFHPFPVSVRLWLPSIRQ